MARRAPASPSSSLAVLALLALAAGSAGACRDKPADEVAAPATTTAAVAPAAVPVDHLAEGELVEGDVDAFGLKIPKGMKVDGRYPDFVRAVGTPAIGALTGYVRARIQGNPPSEDTDGNVTFRGVRALSKPDRLLEVRLTKDDNRAFTRLDVRDSTPPPHPDLPDDEARFRAAGLDKEGHVLNPKTIE